uniref:Uncharacterized protein n=1 Tax=uncultured bacterium contig00004 TaxID=1181496 RepID=A0A806JYI4_9BACT|nr:hypothetical protein [uncultured bacterium contig00004]
MKIFSKNPEFGENYYLLPIRPALCLTGRGWGEQQNGTFSNFQFYQFFLSSL